MAFYGKKINLLQFLSDQNLSFTRNIKLTW
jgi:hypothetical protein